MRYERGMFIKANQGYSSKRGQVQILFIEVVALPSLGEERSREPTSLELDMCIGERKDFENVELTRKDEPPLDGVLRVSKSKD